MTATAVAYGYARKSPTDAPGAVAQHDAEVQEWVRAHMPEHVYRGSFVDEADAERLPLRARPEGLRVSLAADRGDAIVVAHYERAFRSARELVAAMDIWASRGVGLVVIDVGVNPLTAVGRLMAGVFRVLAAAELSKAKERGVRDFTQRRRRGRALNGTPPVGFRFIGPKGRRRLAPDSHVRQVAARVKEWKDAGWSWEAIWRYLRDSGVRQRNGHVFSLTTMRRLYAAAHYAAEKGQAQAGAAS
jgi:DNA invertase Pin-like site-specific DNA recombinase